MAHERFKDNNCEPYPRVVIAFARILKEQHATWYKTLIEALNLMVHIPRIPLNPEDMDTATTLAASRAFLKYGDPLIDNQISLSLKTAWNLDPEWHTLDDASLVRYLQTGCFKRYNVLAVMPEEDASDSDDESKQHKDIYTAETESLRTNLDIPPTAKCVIAFCKSLEEIHDAFDDGVATTEEASVEIVDNGDWPSELDHRKLREVMMESNSRKE